MRLRRIALLDVDLPEIHLRPDIVADRARAPARTRRSPRPGGSATARDQAEQVVRLRRLGQRRRRGRSASSAPRRACRRRTARSRDSAARGPDWRDLQRLPERRGRRVVVELLEQRDAEVVGAVGALSTAAPAIRSAPGPRTAGREQRRAAMTCAAIGPRQSSVPPHRAAAVFAERPCLPRW